MSATLPNIPISKGVWFDIHSLSTIPSGAPVEFQNIGCADLYYSVALIQPIEEDSFKILKRGERATVSCGDLKIWVFSPQTNGLINLYRVFASSRDPNLEVAKGNVPGHTLRGLIMRNLNVSGAFVHLWGGSSDLIFPVANESWEVLSSDVNDNATGTGARLFLQNYLDDDHIERSVVVPLNGINPVPLNSDHFRPDGAAVISSGSSQTNVGKIIVRRVSDSAERQIIQVGFANSQDCHYTVPAGKTMFTRQSLSFYPKDESGFVQSKFKFFGTNTFISGPPLPSYQGVFNIDIKALLAFPEKTDLITLGNSANPGVTVSAILELEIVENEFLGVL